MQRVVVVLMLVLAGCGSTVGPPAGAGSETATVTPAPVPTGTPRAVGLDTLAPGLGPDGVFDARRLAAAHADSLAGQSFTVVQRDRRYANGTLVLGDRSVLRYAAGGHRFDYDLQQTDRRDGANATSRIQRYADGERVFVAVGRGNETTYDVLRASDGSLYAPERVFPANATNRRGLVRLLVLIDTEVTDEWTVGGRTVYRVETTGPGALPPLRNISFVANVTETGLVQSYQLSYEVTRSTGRVHIVAGTTYRDVGTTTVTEPPWVERAKAALRNETDTATPGGLVTDGGLSEAPGA